MSTIMIGVVGQGSGRQNSIPTIPTVPTIPTIPTPWGCSKIKAKAKILLTYILDSLTFVDVSEQRQQETSGQRAYRL